jgi:hypothetical protein
VNSIISFWKNHGTKLIGFLTGTIAAVAGVTGIIPEAHLKYYMAAIAVLTYWRGFFNSAQSQ